MTSRLDAITFDAIDPGRLARFWSDLLARTPAQAPDEVVALGPGEDGGLPIRFRPVAATKTGPGRTHFDLTSASPSDMQQAVERALALGGRHLDIGQDPDDGHVVLADPEGNEFCVIEPENKFLAGCGRVGALNGDGSQEVGYFWSRALGWPLVWDQDQETAIQSSEGGMKIAWGGPPVQPRSTNDRLHVELSTVAAERDTEVARLVSLGATVVDAEGDDGSVTLADPDDNEFRLFAR